MMKRELGPFFSLSSWCLVIVVWLFLAVPWICLQFVIVVIPDHTHLLFYCETRLDDGFMESTTSNIEFKLNFNLRLVKIHGC